MNEKIESTVKNKTIMVDVEAVSIFFIIITKSLN